MLDPTLRAGFDAALETAINTALRYDPGTRARLGKLGGKVIAVNVTAPQMRIYLVIEDDGIEVHQQWAGEVTTELSGSAIAFIQLLRDADTTPAKLGVSVFGSTALLAELQAILRDLEIDWEQPIAELLGDSPAHALGEAVRGVSRWLRGSLAEAPRAAAEAVSEEWRFTPPKAQFEAFADDVTELALATDRLEARIQLLRDKLNRREAD